MPRKRGGRKRGKRRGGRFQGKRELVFKEDTQEYGQITKILGGGRFKCNCFDNKERIAKIRGKFRKRVWVRLEQIVLVQLRDELGDTEKCDIIHVYKVDEIRKLKNAKEIPQNLVMDLKKMEKQENNLDIEFDDEEEKEVKPVKVKQNINDFMPSMSSDEDEDEEIQEKTETTPT